MQVPGSFEKGETGGPVSPEAADSLGPDLAQTDIP